MSPHCARPLLLTAAQPAAPIPHGSATSIREVYPNGFQPS